MQESLSFLRTLNQWAAQQSDIQAVVLVGSHARGTARADSDIDVVILTETPQPYLLDEGWLNTFGQAVAVEDEDWGMVQSRRTYYSSGLEVEFGLTTPEWASTDPMDDGTREVIAAGAQIIYDPEGILAALLAAVR